MSILVASILGACAAAASELRPGHVPHGEGAVFGRVRVFKGDDEVTSRCSVAFTDKEKEHKAAASLADSGWIFTSLAEGPTYLSLVSCAVWNGLSYHTRALDFNISGRDRITYFGHVRFDLADEDMKKLGEAIMSGAVGVPVASVAGAIVTNAATATGMLIRETSADGTNVVSVEDQSDYAIRRYRTRYLSNPDVVVSLAGDPPARDPAPGTVVAVNDDDVAAQAQERVSSEAVLDGVKLAWWGVARSDTRQLGLRLQRYARKPELQGCKEIELVIDGKSTRLPLTYNAESSSTIIKETVEVETDLATVKAVTSAKSVTLKACNLVRKLSTQGVDAASKVVTAYTALIAKLPAGADATTPQATEAIATVPPEAPATAPTTP